MDNKIEAFIQAIKKQNKEYFKNVNDNDPIMYKELEFTFEKGYFVRQCVSMYFNLVYGKEIFASNEKFLARLKEKDKMFKQEVDIVKALNERKQEEVLFEGTPIHKEVRNNKLYKINDYTLPKDINVPCGWIITNRKGNQRFKYNYEDVDLAKEDYKQYDKSNANLKCVP